MTTDTLKELTLVATRKEDFIRSSACHWRMRAVEREAGAYRQLHRLKRELVAERVEVLYSEKLVTNSERAWAYCFSYILEWLCYAN